MCPLHPVAQEIDSGAELVAIHDSARPLVTAEDTMRCFQDALEVRSTHSVRSACLAGTVQGSAHVGSST